jgi:hypothetical protein
VVGSIDVSIELTFTLAFGLLIVLVSLSLSCSWLRAGYYWESKLEWDPFHTYHHGFVKPF